LAAEQVDHELEPGRLLDRQISRLCPFENLVDKIARATEQIRRVQAIRHETSRCEEISEGMHRGQSRTQRQGIDAGVVGVDQRVGTDIKRLRAALVRTPIGLFNGQIGRQTRI
jgi:hypothetical protein